MFHVNICIPLTMVAYDSISPLLPFILVLNLRRGFYYFTCFTSKVTSLLIIPTMFPFFFYFLWLFYFSVTSCNSDIIRYIWSWLLTAYFLCSRACAFVCIKSKCTIRHFYHCSKNFFSYDAFCIIWYIVLIRIPRTRVKMILS